MKSGSDRILIFAPMGRDAELARDGLRTAGLHAHIVHSVKELCDEMHLGAGAALITEEALSPFAMDCIADELLKQSAWSDFPIIVFTSCDTTM